MQAGSFVSLDVQAFSHRVLVNGIPRETVSWSIDRDLPSGLPAQVVAVHGTPQATGSIEWAAQDRMVGDRPVGTAPANPWNQDGGWVPQRGDRVQIWVSDGVTQWQQFEGLIDVTRGAVGGALTSSIVDRYDQFSAQVDHPTMLNHMPPRGTNNTPWRAPGVNPLYYVDLALRRARFYVTPPREHNALLYVPLQGSLWPHWGYLDNNGEHIAGGTNTVTPWGVGKADFVSYYAPTAAPVMSQTLQVSFMVAPAHASATDITLSFGTGQFLRVSIGNTRIIRVYRGSTLVTQLSLQNDEWVVSVLFKAGQAEICTDTGRVATGAFSSGGSGLSRVIINAGAESSIAGVQMSRPQNASQEHASTRVALTARLNADSLRLTGSLVAAPNIEDVTAERLLAQINDALLAVTWIDETGTAQWAQSDTLRRRTPVKTVTTADDIFDLTWESGLLQSASSVTITGKRPSVTRSSWRIITVAEASNSLSLRAGDSLELFLEPGTDEDWVIPATNFLEVGGTSGIWGSFNNPEYSTVGLHFERDGEEISGSVPYQTTITTHQLGYQKTLVKYQAGNWPADVEGILSTPQNNTLLWPRNRNQPIVRLKAKGKVEWYDDKITIPGPAGPGPELVHDVGCWSNYGEYADTVSYWERLGAYLASQVAVPQPVIRDIAIQPDPRLQLGDVITIESNLIGVTLTALITSLSQGAGPNGYYQALGVQIISVDSTAMTYEEFQARLPGTTLTYEAWQALGPLPQTYSQFNTSDEG